MSGREIFIIGRWAVPSEGSDTKKGRMTELVKDVKENKTNAKDPFLAISPTMSFVACSSAALSAFSR